MSWVYFYPSSSFSHHDFLNNDKLVKVFADLVCYLQFYQVIAFNNFYYKKVIYLGAYNDFR